MLSIWSWPHKGVLEIRVHHPCATFLIYQKGRDVCLVIYFSSAKNQKYAVVPTLGLFSPQKPTSRLRHFTKSGADAMIHPSSQLPWSLQHLRSSLWGCRRLQPPLWHLDSRAFTLTIRHGLASQFSARYAARSDKRWDHPPPPSPTDSRVHCWWILLSRCFSRILPRSFTARWFLPSCPRPAFRSLDATNPRSIRLARGTIADSGAAAVWSSWQHNCRSRCRDCTISWYIEANRWAGAWFRSD